MVAEDGGDDRSRLCPEPYRSDSRLYSDSWLPGRCDLATFGHLASNQADARRCTGGMPAADLGVGKDSATAPGESSRSNSDHLALVGTVGRALEVLHPLLSRGCIPTFGLMSETARCVESVNLGSLPISSLSVEDINAQLPS